MARPPDPGHDHDVDRGGEADVEVTATDAELLAGLRRRGRGSVWQLVVALVFLALGTAQAVTGTWWLGVGYLLIGVFHLWSWWVDPRARVRAVTAEGLLLQRGLRTQTVARIDLVDVHPRHTRAYGLELSVRGGKRIRLDGTAPRFSLADAQAAALRRWAGLDR